MKENCCILKKEALLYSIAEGNYIYMCAHLKYKDYRSAVYIGFNFMLCYFYFWSRCVRTVPSGHAFYPWTLHLFPVSLLLLMGHWRAIMVDSELHKELGDLMSTRTALQSLYLCVLVPTYKWVLVKAVKTSWRDLSFLCFVLFCFCFLTMLGIIAQSTYDIGIILIFFSVFSQFF